MAIYYRSVLKREPINRWGRIGYREYLEIVQTEDISKFNYRKKIKFRLYIENDRIFIDEEKQAYFENCLKLVKNIDEIYSVSLWGNMETTKNYIGIIKKGDKLLSLITDKPLKIKGLLSTQRIVLPLSFNYKVVDIATKIKSCYENYTRGNKYIFYIYVSIKGNVVYMIYDLIPRKELKNWYKMKIIIPVGNWVTALEIMDEIKKLFDEEVKKMWMICKFF